MKRRILSPVLGLIAVGLIIAAATAIGQPPPTGNDPELPESTLVIDIDAAEESLYRIAVPNLRGPAHLGTPAGEVVRNDLTLIALFDVLPSRNYPNDAHRGLDISSGEWGTAQGVVKGEVQSNGGPVSVEMRFYELPSARPSIVQTYRGSEGEVRGFMHDFANRVVDAVTRQAAHFDTQITYAKRIGPGRKDVYVSDFDGFNEQRVSNGEGVAMLPTFGPDGIWYSRLTQTGMWITRSGLNERALIGGEGLTMSPTICEGRVFFSSTRDGNPEIYSARLDGNDIRRLTNDPGIDVSPSCGPGGSVAFISTRHGTPQVFVTTITGGDPRRVTFRGNHNQTPAWCPLPGRPLIAFTGRSNGLDIFTVNVNTQEYVRLTQGPGFNKDPAWSPDCRMIAFASTREDGGVYISNPRGFHQNRVVMGMTETVRWSR